MSATKAMLRDFFQTLQSEGNVAAMRYTSDDFSWWHPVHGTFTRADMQGMDDALAQMFDGPVRFTIHTILEDCEHAAIEAEIDVALKPGGRYQNTYLFLVKLRDGKIASLKEYNDTLRASRAFPAAA
jgi:ketosteroid isomerase-like protein